MEFKKVEAGIGHIVNDNVKKLAQLFPTAVKDGEVDFDALKEELGQFKEVESEKYEFTWAGKQNAKKIAQEDIFGKTLKFIAEDSKEADTTENLYIEGDNLEALKLLRRNYYGAVKMIYIDPPYNTGNDFIYNDSFAMSKKDSDFAENNLSLYGEQYSVNSKSQNRYHANWINMMYPRLKVAKDLLKDDGVIFISIDDNEIDNLSECCNEVFGKMNFVTNIIWQKKTGASDAKGIATITEYILVYCKNYQVFEDIFTKNTESYDINRYRYRDEFYEERGPYYIDNLDRGGLQYSDSLNYGIECPDGTVTFPNGRREYANDGWIWKWSRKKIQWAMENKFIEFRKTDKKNSGWSVCYKNYLNVDNENKTIERAAPHKNLIIDVLNAHAASTMKELFHTNNYFNYAKPIELIEKIMSFVKLDNEIVVDFFSGSATTAHAVMAANSKNNKKTRYILIQLPEPIKEGSEAYKEGYRTICDIGKERIRRAGAKIKEEKPDTDTGFKVFRVDDTNIKWNSSMDLGQLDIDQIKNTPDQMDFMPDAKDTDIVYELILRQREVSLSAEMVCLPHIGERTYLYDSSYLICLEPCITEKLVGELADLKPLPIKFIFRDSAFKDDIVLKDGTMRRLKALADKNSGNNRKTYTVEFI